MLNSLITWALAVMNALQPSAPWRQEYESIAQGIVEGAQSEPLFEGESGFLRTVALDLSVAWFESRYNRHAVGDHGAAHGLYQVHGPEAATVKQQTIEANRMMRASFKICGRRPFPEWLGWYAAGGQGCRGIQASKHRIGLAQRLIKERPFNVQGDSDSSLARGM